VTTFVSGPRPREDGDTRRDLPSYTLTNLTLIGKNFIDNFEIRGSVYNLFDKSYEMTLLQKTQSLPITLNRVGQLQLNHVIRFD
jgi:outer membrane receptor for ferrienterochelin and colicin